MISIAEARENNLLDLLPESTLAAWLPSLDKIDLSFRETLIEDKARFKKVYFPTTAIFSFVHILRDGSSTETALVGKDGMVGVALVYGTFHAMNHVITKSAGTCLQLDIERFRHFFNSDNVLQAICMRYTQALFMQASQMSVCTRHHNLNQHLCRLLLMMQDRLSEGDLIITHEVIATMLGVRRESVTEAARKLQSKNIIHYTRGRIQIVNRKRLEDHACECYEIQRTNYENLLKP